MTREIKFRAWDKTRNLMLPVKLIDWAEWWVSCDPTYGNANPLAYGERNGFRNENSDRHMIMQFTGLHDKNGKDVYEGDILRITEVDNNGISEWITDVHWDACAFMVMGYGVDYYDTFFGAYEEGGVRYPLAEIEVIGNIYENPELLAKQTS